MYKPIWEKHQNTFTTCFYSIMVEFYEKEETFLGIKGMRIYGKLGKWPKFTHSFGKFYSNKEYEKVLFNKQQLKYMYVESVLFNYIKETSL